MGANGGWFFGSSPNKGPCLVSAGWCYMEASGGCIRASGGRMGAIRHMGMWALVKAVWGLVESYWGQDEIRTIGGYWGPRAVSRLVESAC